MGVLTKDQINQYKDEGYISPIDVFNQDEIKKIKNEIEYIEKNGQKN